MRPGFDPAVFRVMPEGEPFGDRFPASRAKREEENKRVSRTD
jgi:hypothetical protein